MIVRPWWVVFFAAFAFGGASSLAWIALDLSDQFLAGCIVGYVLSLLAVGVADWLCYRAK